MSKKQIWICLTIIHCTKFCRNIITISYIRGLQIAFIWTEEKCVKIPTERKKMKIEGPCRNSVIQSISTTAHIKQGRIHDLQIEGVERNICTKRTSRARSAKSLATPGGGGALTSQLDGGGGAAGVKTWPCLKPLLCIIILSLKICCVPHAPSLVPRSRACHKHCGLGSNPVINGVVRQ